MNRNEREYYKDITKIAKQLEIANKLKMLELSGELGGFSASGITTHLEEFEDYLKNVKSKNHE